MYGVLLVGGGGGQVPLSKSVLFLEMDRKQSRSKFHHALKTVEILELLGLECHALPHHPIAARLRWIYPNGVTRLAYHGCCLTDICLQTDPVKDLHQDVKHPLKSYRSHGRNAAVVSAEVRC